MGLMKLIVLLKIVFVVIYVMRATVSVHNLNVMEQLNVQMGLMK